MSRYDSILFDFDGVLSDTEPLHFECWKEALADFGIDPGWEWFAQNCIGVSEHDTLRALGRMAPRPVDFDTLWARYPRKKELFRQLVAKGIPLAPGAPEMLQELHGDYAIAVVSSSNRLEVQPALEIAGVWEYFSAAVCGSEVAHLKPAPDPYLRAAELLKARRPLVVEDSAAGVASAQAAHFDFVRVASVAEMVQVVRERLKDDNKLHG